MVTMSSGTPPEDRGAESSRGAVPLDRVVIVGASLAGLRAAETLRQRAFAGDVVVVGAETHRPYDRPPLSKKLLSGEWDADRIHLRQPEAFDELDVRWELGVAGERLDLAERTLRAGRRSDPRIRRDDHRHRCRTEAHR